MKRFTETNKWRDAWFRRLSAPAKLAWVYLTENCDAVGMIEIDLGLLSDDCGVKVLPGHLAELGSRLQKVTDHKFFIPKFIHFQYGELSDKCPPHRTIIRLIEMHGLRKEGMLYLHPNGAPLPAATVPVNPPAVPPKAPESCPDIALAIYDAYPRKLGRKDALVSIRKAMAKMDPAKLLDVTIAYAKAVEGKEMQFVPYPATWFNGEHFFDDPAMWNPPTAPAANNGKPLSIFEMKTVLEAKNKAAQDLKNAFASEGPLTTDWNNEQAREKFKVLRKEIADLTAKLASVK